MNNSITRLFKPKVDARVVDLNAESDGVHLPSATCEVIEYDITTGIEQWNDSVFLQDFEDSQDSPYRESQFASTDFMQL